MADEFCLKMPDFHVTFRDLLHALNLRLYFPSEGTCAEDFFALKNPTASAGFEPANLGTKGQHATFRPPKPLNVAVTNTWFSVHSAMHKCWLIHFIECDIVCLHEAREFVISRCFLKIV